MVKSMNHQYIESLIKLGEKNENIVVLDSDSSRSSRTYQFKENFPSRFFNCGISEQNMTGIASGLAYEGKTPFIHSIAPFVVRRSYDQLYQAIAVPNLNIKVVGLYAGLNGPDGLSHQILNDIALMSSLPNFSVVIPGNSYEVEKIMENIIDNGPTYIRLSRAFKRKELDKKYSVKIGKFSELRKGNDVVIIATGLMLDYALDIAESLNQRNIHAGVYSCHSLKPFDEEKLVTLAKNTGKVITLEEHLTDYGLTSTINNILATSLPMKILKIGVENPLSGSGPLEDLFKHNNLLPNQNIKNIERYLNE